MELSKSIKKFITDSGKISSSSLRELYSSIDAEGNVCAAYSRRPGTTLLTRGLSENINPEGILHRVPIRYNRGKEAVDGYLLFLPVITDSSREEELFSAMANNLTSDAPFAVCNPENECQTKALYKLGFVPAKETTFPYACASGRFDGYTEGTIGDYHKIMRKRESDGFTSAGLFLAWSLSPLKILLDGEGGYALVKISGSFAVVYDEFSPKGNDMPKEGRIKTLVYGLDGEVESVNVFGETRANGEGK